MRLDLFGYPSLLGRLFDRPGDGLSHSLPQDGPTGFADGRQHTMRPITHTALPHLRYEQAVRQHDEIHVPGLALAFMQLTVSHAQILLAVPVKGFRARPALAVDVKDPGDLPMRPIGKKHLDGFLAIFPIPQDHQPHPMIDFGNLEGLGEIPLFLVADAHGLAEGGIDLSSQFRSRHLPSLKPHLAIELEIAYIAPLVGVNMVENLGVGEVAVEDELTGDFRAAANWACVRSKAACV